MKNIKLAKELIKLAQELIAEEQINLIVTEDGVEQVSLNQFNKLFNTRIASNDPNDIKQKTVIYVSPCVNATNPPEDGIKGIPTRLKNFMSTVLNKLNHKKIIFDTIMKNEDEQRGKKQNYYHLGCTIETGKGVYPSGLQNKIYIQESYIITIYGASKQESFKIAQSLSKQFKQESVLVEYNEKVFDKKEKIDKILNETKYVS